MKWEKLGTYNINDFWQFTPIVTAKIFRITHILLGINAFRPTAIVALASTEKNELGATETYQPQALKYYLESEIIQFNNVPKNWEHRLGFKQIILSSRNIIIDWRVQVDMSPVVDLNADQPPINPGISTTKNVTSVPMNGTTPVRLLPVNTTNSRNGATFYNPSTLRSLIIDTDANINTASAVARVAPGKLYISDFPEWQGEYWGVLDGTGTPSIPVEEYVK